MFEKGCISKPPGIPPSFVGLLFASHFLLPGMVGRGRGDEVVTLACAAEDSGHFDELDGHF